MKREIHTVSRCNIGGDSECKVSGVAKRGGKQQQAKSRERGRGWKAATSEEREQRPASERESE
jgi:hypothetical protein